MYSYKQEAMSGTIVINEDTLEIFAEDLSPLAFLPEDIENIILDYRNQLEYQEHRIRFQKTLDKIITFNPDYCHVCQEIDEDRLLFNIRNSRINICEYCDVCCLDITDYPGLKCDTCGDCISNQPNEVLCEVDIDDIFAVCYPCIYH